VLVSGGKSRSNSGFVASPVISGAEISPSHRSPLAIINHIVHVMIMVLFGSSSLTIVSWPNHVSKVPVSMAQEITTVPVIVILPVKLLGTIAQSSQTHQTSTSSSSQTCRPLQVTLQ